MEKQMIIYWNAKRSDEKQIVEKLNLKQSTVNQHSTSIGWQAIEKAVLFFENIMQSREEAV